MKTKNWLSGVLIALSACSRFFPHPYNLSPIMPATWLVGSKGMASKISSIASMVLVLLFTDILLNYYVYDMGNPFLYMTSATFIFTYLGHLSAWAVGTALLSKTSFVRITGAAVGGSIAFFLLSNLGVYLEVYNLKPLWNVYLDGLPFYKNTLIGNILFSYLFFGIYSIAFKEQKETISI